MGSGVHLGAVSAGPASGLHGPESLARRRQADLGPRQRSRTQMVVHERFTAYHCDSAPRRSE
jgi:hypothetical protein